MRVGSTLYYLFGDHLGSSSVSLRASDSNTLTQRYHPWGTIRPGPDNGLPTDYTFTGQKLDTSTGLMYYVARYYDPVLGRFAQADTIVPEPGNPQALNRYSYTLNNPVKYMDPSGHYVFEEDPAESSHGWDARVRSRYWYTHPNTNQTYASDADVLLAFASPVIGLVGALGLGEVVQAADPVAYAVRGIVSGIAGVVGDALSQAAQGESYDLDRLPAAFIPNFVGGGFLGEVYPALPSAARLATAGVTNVFVSGVQRIWLDDERSATDSANDFTIGVASSSIGEGLSIVLSQFVPSSLVPNPAWRGALTGGISSFASHTGFISAVKEFLDQGR